MSNNQDLAQTLADRLQIPQSITEQVIRSVEKFSQTLAEQRQLEIKYSEAKAKPRCTGRDFWQAGEPYAGGKLYANHSAGTVCPIHGRHKSTSTPLRKYIGTKPDAVQATLEAMQNQKELEEIYQQLNRVKANADTEQYRLTDIYNQRAPRWHD